VADPVEIGSLALAGRFDATCDAVADTQAVLAALHGAGWRVVRTEQIGWTRPNPWDIGPAWRGLYKGDDPGDGWTPAHRITDEWTPGSDSCARCSAPLGPDDAGTCPPCTRAIWTTTAGTAG